MESVKERRGCCCRCQVDGAELELHLGIEQAFARIDLKTTSILREQHKRGDSLLLEPNCIGTADSKLSDGSY